MGLVGKLNFGISDNCEISIINVKTGEKIAFDTNIKDFEITQKDTPHDYMPFLHNTEVTLELKNFKWFPEELSKLYYMKTHVKTKRLKKKYNKLFNQKQSYLFKESLGINI